MSEEFGLEVVLGAFLAGAMVSMLDREHAVRTTGLQEKLDGIGFGVFIPIFFVVSGVRLDLDSLFSSFDTIVLVPLTVIAMLVVRGAPALLYRRFVPEREAVSVGLVTGGVISVLVFPALALRVLRPA